MLNFEQFQEYVKDNIRDFLPEELKNANVELRSVTKNNGKQLQAITVRPEKSNIAPTVYLNEYFNQYVRGADLNDVMKDIAYISSEHQVKDDFGDIAHKFFDFDYVKDKIVMTLVNAEKNQEMLKNTPHVMKEDLAIIYKVIVDMEGIKDGMSTITILNAHMEAWNQDVETLHNLAMENSNRLFPASVQSMDKIIMEMMGGGELPDEIKELMMAERPADEQIGGYG